MLALHWPRCLPERPLYRLIPVVHLQRPDAGERWPCQPCRSTIRRTGRDHAVDTGNRFQCCAVDIEGRRASCTRSQLGGSCFGLTRIIPTAIEATEHVDAETHSWIRGGGPSMNT